jgi:hypothetical protein
MSEHEEPYSRGQVRMEPPDVDVADEFRERHLSILHDLF